MPSGRQESYKTEEQLKQEAKKRRVAEAAAAAARPESKLKQKRENFWYHYKWHTIVGVTVVVLAVFFIRDMFFHPNPDATIIMVSESYYSMDDIDAVAAAIEEKTGGASVIIDYIALPSTSEEGQAMGGSQDYANNMKLVTVTAANIDPIYLLDEAAYSFFMEMGRQEDGEPAADNIFDPKSVPAERLGEEYEGLRFYLRRYACKDEDYYERCKELLKIINGG